MREGTTTSDRRRRGLYPPIEPYRQDRLAVGDGHVLYYEESGNRHGKPVLVVHGGPGGGSNPTMRRYHDPSRYRIVLFDQRGCGRSTPNACLEANTTWHLVEDMEKLRKHLGIDRWQLLGGSWGSTLSIAYAERYPERVSELLLRGIFLLRRAEIDWFYQDGANWIFPDTYQPFRDLIPPAERADMVAAYYKRLTGPDRRTQIEAARAWSLWEGSTLSLLADPERLKLFGVEAYALAFARIESHYFVNRGFLGRDTQLLDEAKKLAGIPGLIVHGRYDVVTPLKNAWELKAVWPAAELEIIPDAGHAMTEPGIVDAIVAGTRRFAEHVEIQQSGR
ncbi:MAG TPA: prolyl aminopeptidase [Hyphomicrobiaceae bacterium]|nr:prolyl aminopeptidase [Hyphomicrobiaceae bacterium]